MLSITTLKYKALLSITWQKSQKKTAIKSLVSVAINFTLEKLKAYSVLNVVGGIR